MMIDEMVTIGSILNALKEGHKAEEVAKAIDGISQKPLLKALRDAGYVYSNKAPKGWRYVGEGEEPTEKSVFDYVKRSSPGVIRSNTRVKRSNTDVNSGNADVNSPVVHTQFTREEISDLVEMLHEWRLSRGAVQEPTQLHERIKALPKDDKKRKTIVIDKSIAKQLEEYSKSELVDQSDVLHLALIDFFKNN